MHRDGFGRIKQLRVKDGILKHFMNNRDLRISTHDHPLMSLKDGSKLLEEMPPFNNVKGGPHRESLETTGIMETVSHRCFIYSCFLLEIQDQKGVCSIAALPLPSLCQIRRGHPVIHRVVTTDHLLSLWYLSDMRSHYTL